MKHRSKNELINGLLILAFLISTLWVPSLNAAAMHAGPDGPEKVSIIPPPGALSLVRIDVNGGNGLRTLAEMRLKVYARLPGPGGKTMVVLPAGAGLRTTLAQRGFAVQVLEAQVDPAGYYLLYGLPQALDLAAQRTPVLLAYGRQAVARASGAPVAALNAAGVRTQLLTAQAVTRAETAIRSPEAVEGASAANPLVQGMLDQVSQAALAQSVAQLSGEQPVTISGVEHLLTSRFTFSEAMIQLATQYAYETLGSYGLKTSFDAYQFQPGVQRRNVIAEQTGLTEPGKVVLLTAHLDSLSNIPWTLAPGADDNATGSAAVLQVAQILSQYDFGCTLRYALFTGEEQGLIGSNDYAADVRARGENLRGVINLDMLGYNSTGTTATFEIHTRPGDTGDLAIASLISDTLQAYSLDLIPVLLPDGQRSSDHASFWTQGYPAVMSIEDWTDHTPNYHRTTDQLETLNLPYYTEMVKAAVASFAHMGCLLDGQVNGVVRAADGAAPLAGAQVSAWQDGRLVRTVETGVDGRYWLPLLAGTYTVKFSSQGYQSSSQESVAVVKNETVTVDGELTACDTVQGTAFVFDPPVPLVQQTVAFTASVSGGAQPITYTWSFGDGEAAAGPQVSHSYALPGLYTVTLSANNACDYARTATGNLAVGLTVLYMPLIEK